MRILIDDGMQIKVGTGIGKYSLYLYKELKKHLEKKDSVELLQFDKGSSSKKQGRLKYLLYINSKKSVNSMMSFILLIMLCHLEKIEKQSIL